MQVYVLAELELNAENYKRMIIRPRLSDYYNIPLLQAEVDFAIPFMDEDIPLYVDPFLLWNHCTLWTDFKVIWITAMKVLKRADINNVAATLGSVGSYTGF